MRGWRSEGWMKNSNEAPPHPAFGHLLPHSSVGEKSSDRVAREHPTFSHGGRPSGRDAYARDDTLRPHISLSQFNMTSHGVCDQSPFSLTHITDSRILGRTGSSVFSTRCLKKSRHIRSPRKLPSPGVQRRRYATRVRSPA